ncbi:MAG: four-carbon acid sugar kinase family protein [Marinilabiliales bacterium]|nr:four-carbon acid sugar kinase family protein [Marinilabiliales bacterium]
MADDFTGACRNRWHWSSQGAKTVIETELAPFEEADILIIATDSRSDSTEKAMEKAEKVTRQLMSLSPDFIIKNWILYSRGNVADELLTQMKVSGKKSCCRRRNPSLAAPSGKASITSMEPQWPKHFLQMIRNFP